MSREGILGLLRQYILEILLIILVITMSLLNANFLSAGNLLNILKNMSLQGVIALGMTIVIIGGELDLSVGSTVALTGVIIGLSCEKFGGSDPNMIAGVLIGVILAIAAAILIGLCNSLFILKYKLPAMIVTIATQFVIYGITATLCKGYPVTTLPRWFNVFGAGTIANIPIMAFVLLISFVIIFIIMNKTKIGRNIYAVGGNAEAARLSGINVKTTKIFIMIAIQICCVISGILLSSQVMSGSFSFGKGWEMMAIAAVVIGGTSLNGGIGKVGGTFIGLLFLGVILNAMVLMNVTEYIQYIVKGGLILFAVVINSFNTKKAN